MTHKLKILLLTMTCLWLPLYAQTINPRVMFETNKGPVIIECYQNKAPKSVENFLDYVSSGFYDNTIFHRVMTDFMAQGGGFDIIGKQKKTKKPIKNEATNGLKNTKYTVAMARTTAPHSATSQFFINTNNNHFLNFKTTQRASGWGYTVFGKVIKESQSVIDTLNNTQTKVMGMHQNYPINPIIIQKAYILPEKNGK